MRISEYLRHQARARPRQEAVVHGDQRLSFADLDESVDRLSAGLARIGVRAGHRIALCLPNGVDFVRVFLAACRLGAVTVPINLRLADTEIAYLISDSDPAVVITTGSRWRTLGGRVGGGARPILVGDLENADGRPVHLDDLPLGAAEPLPEVGLDEAEDCAICYTSGTTGRPKGAVLTQSNYVFAHGYLNAVSWALGPGDRTLITTPMAHRTGLARIVNMVCQGSTVVIMSKFDVPEATRLIETERITVLGMVPTVGRMLIEAVEAAPHRFASLRIVLGTGEAFPPSLADRFEAARPDLRVHAFFAMTEVGQIAGLEPEERHRHPGSVGRPVPGLEIKLVDESGARVPTGRSGEIVVRGGRPGQFLVMREYYKNPDATREALRDGWLATGDVGRFDEDGFLYLVDRKKDMIVSGGYNIYSREVENVIRELPGVVEVAVVGFPDEHYGESVAAFIQLAPGEKLAEADVVEHCRRHLADYKKPRRVVFVDDFPRSPVGKLLKRELRETARSYVER